MARRLTNTAIVFFLAVIINFLLPRLMPGNFALFYVEQLKQETSGLGGITPQALEAQINSLFGLNLPLYGQFLRYLHEVFSFPPDFGPSFQYYPASAFSLVGIGLPWTLLLVGTSQLVSWLVGIVLGVFLAIRKGSRLDRFLQPLNAFLLTIPVFWLALLMVIFFGIDLRWLPTGGAYSVTPTVPSVLVHMILPLSTLVIANFPAYTIVMRNSALEVLSSDFVTAMKAQGLSRGTFLKRVIKNSLLPSITALFLSLGGVIGGVFTIEYVFAYPGVGNILVSAIYARDFPVMQAVLFLTVLVVILANLAADLIYPLIDPRVSYVK